MKQAMLLVLFVGLFAAETAESGFSRRCGNKTTVFRVFQNRTTVFRVFKNSDRNTTRCVQTAKTIPVEIQTAPAPSVAIPVEIAPVPPPISDTQESSSVNPFVPFEPAAATKPTVGTEKQEESKKATGTVDEKINSKQFRLVPFPAGYHKGDIAEAVKVVT